jgi:ribosomal protein L7/L12
MNLDELENRARALIDQNQKIEAIKLVREATGWGLRESKDYVDALARAALPALSKADEAAMEQEVDALLQQDRYVEAIKLVQERTGWGLGDCKAYVDALTKGDAVNWVSIASRVSELLDYGLKDKAIEWITAQGRLDARQAQDYVDFVLTAKSTHSSPGNLEPPTVVVSQIRDLLAQDRKIEAVKLVRILTNWGLRDSKDCVDSLEAKKKRRKRRRKRAKTPPAGAGFKVGDSVVVKPEGVDPEFDVGIGSWCGRVAEEPGADGMVLISWDSVTLRDMPESLIVQCEEQGLDWTRMVLGVQDIELTSARDTEADVVQVVDELSKQYGWIYLGEEGHRINKVLAGIDPRDEMAVLRAWEEHLGESLVLPFDAEVSEYQTKGSLRIGDRVTVQDIVDVDDLYGVIVRLTHRRRRYAFPLCDLEASDKHSPNYQLVRDYAVWFANR